MRFVVGIDEAGRGPLAGPVAVGIVMAPERYDISKHFPGVADSKQLTAAKREILYELLLSRVSKQELQFTVRFSSSLYIDRFGITRAVRRSLYSGVHSLAPESHKTRILLDGLLHAPEEYEQETIIGGDASVPIISLASIAAKVERDRLMKRLSKRYPHYGFELHKGYGTKAHLAAISTYGLSDIHRRTYCIRQGAD